MEHNTNYSDDLELVSKYKETKDFEFVAILYQRYSHLIFGVCMKYLKNTTECEDASIQIFEKLLIDLQKHDIKQFKAWLYMLTKNFCLMKLRSDLSKFKKEKEYSSFMETENNLHLTNDTTKEIKLTAMEECIQLLNLEQKVCIELFYIKELSYQQVVDETNYTINNVKSYIQNGKRNLKNCIESKAIS